MRAIQGMLTLGLLALTNGCGFFQSLTAKKEQEGAVPQAMIQEDARPFEMDWLENELGLSSADAQDPISRCEKLCKPSQWLRVELSLNGNLPWIVPARIPGNISPSVVSEIRLQAESQVDKKNPKKKSFSCSYQRVLKQNSSAQDDYKLKSCTENVKASTMCVVTLPDGKPPRFKPNSLSAPA